VTADPIEIGGAVERRPPAQQFTHADARVLWGEPDEQQGSVNDPRTREEHGIRFNERWVYRLPDGAQRLVYWHRYDWRGTLRVRPGGEVLPEPL
jgi:hypothetical protein